MFRWRTKILSHPPRWSRWEGTSAQSYTTAPRATSPVDLGRTADPGVYPAALCGGRARPALSHLGARSRRGPGLGWWAPPGTHCLSLDPPGGFQPEHTSHTHLGSGCFPLEVLSFSPGIPLTGGWEGLATWGGLNHGTVGTTQGPPEAWPSALLCCPSSQILWLKASQEGVSSSASRAAGRGYRWSPGHAHSRRMAHAFLGTF